MHCCGGLFYCGGCFCIIGKGNTKKCKNARIAARKAATIKCMVAHQKLASPFNPAKLFYNSEAQVLTYTKIATYSGGKQEETKKENPQILLGSEKKKKREEKAEDKKVKKTKAGNIIRPVVEE